MQTLLTQLGEFFELTYSLYLCTGKRTCQHL